MNHILCTILLIPLLSANVSAQVTITSSGSYSQNFDTLPSTGFQPWNNNATLPGWYAAVSFPGGLSITADRGVISGNGLFSYGSTSTSDRALGVYANNYTFALALSFFNNSGQDVALTSLAYSGEQWRVGFPDLNFAHSDFLLFGYRVSPTSIADALSGTDADWTRVTALDFASLIESNEGQPLNGNANPNRVLLSSPLSITVPANNYVMLRWIDGPEYEPNRADGLAIDDLTATFQVVPEPAITSQIALGFVLLCLGVRSKQGRKEVMF